MQIDRGSNSDSAGPMSFAPDKEQLKVIDASPDERMIVTAGPGSGKTFTAAQRLIRLINENDLDGNYLALSFSRAAAQAIDDALSRAGLRGRVQVRTVDSWAGRINQEFAAPDEIDDVENHDDGIGLAIRTLSNLSEEKIGSIDYLVIDEAQDIFGIRAEFLMQVCSKSWVGGWAVLGDLAQKIYDFSNNALEEHESFLEKISAIQLDRPILKLSLLTDHRCSNPELFKIRELGKEIRSLIEPDVVPTLWSELNNFPVIGSMDQLVGVAEVMSKQQVSTALLVRSNRLALETSSALSAAGVKHRNVGSSTEDLVPAWVANIQACRSKSELISQCPDFVDSDLLVIEVTKLCSRGSGDSFDMRHLAQRIRERRLPRVLLQNEKSGLTVSTIHQSKGLEFDRVILEIERPTGARGDILQETRVLFVGLTRAKDEVLRFQMNVEIRSDRSHDRSVDFVWGRNRRPVGIELKASDLQFLRPIPRDLDLELRRLSVRADGVPHYGLYVEGDNECLANVSEGFGRTVHSNWWAKCPQRFVGILQTGVQTIARPSTYGVRDEPEALLVQVPIYRSMLKVGE